VASQSSETRFGPAGKSYPWVVVGLLWGCGFLNYADRQAVTAVFPQLRDEFALSNTQIGMISTSFMIVYASTAPIAGFFVDRMSRRLLISAGLAFWSMICAGTAISGSFNQIIFFRAAEGLGESFYFPASMSVLAGYHGPRTRSRAMSIHQTSVYAGQALGPVFAGWLAEQWQSAQWGGWRSPFWVLGGVGIVYAVILGFILVEPRHERPPEEELAPDPRSAPEFLPDPEPMADGGTDFLSKFLRICRHPSVSLLFLVFIGANFVATAYMSWLNLFIHDKFHLNIIWAAVVAAAWPVSSMVGCLAGGVLADRASRRRFGGRMRVQGLGLLLGAPFLFITGWANGIPLAVLGLAGAGFFKGVYDSNIFASLYDVVEAYDRGLAAGLMNTVGWTGGLLAPVMVGWTVDQQYITISVAMASTGMIYVLTGCVAFLAAWVAESRLGRPGATS
jgi:MFS family permease